MKSLFRSRSIWAILILVVVSSSVLFSFAAPTKMPLSDYIDWYFSNRSEFQVSEEDESFRYVIRYIPSEVQASISAGRESSSEDVKEQLELIQNKLFFAVEFIPSEHHNADKINSCLGTLPLKTAKDLGLHLQERFTLNYNQQTFTSSFSHLEINPTPLGSKRFIVCFEKPKGFSDSKFDAAELQFDLEDMCFSSKSIEIDKSVFFKDIEILTPDSTDS